MDGADHARAVCSHVLEHMRGNAIAFRHQRDQQLCGADVRLVLPPRLLEGQLDDLLHA